MRFRLAWTLMAAALLTSCGREDAGMNAHEEEGHQAGPALEASTLPLTATECAQAGGQCDASNTCVRQEYRCYDGCGFIPVSLGECGNTPPPPPPTGGGGGGTIPRCQCTVRISSKDRYMRGKFDLECGGHGGHGFCGTNVDTRIHTPGCGAMTGKIRVAFGTASAELSCPDDHKTCFRGPASCDGGGTWPNLCSCDSNGDLPAGVTTVDQFDPTEVVQYNAVLNAQGACGSVELVVNERIIEHDPRPLGRDDPLGHLITEPIRPGVGTQIRNLAVSNSIPPVGPRGSYSGEFGAVLKVQTTCTQL